jgi:hypothetical protein
MSENKPSYLSLTDAMKPVAVVRMLEIKAKNNNKEYRGSSFEEIMQATQKLEKNISKEELAKRIEEADAWGFFKYHIDIEKKRRLYNFDDSVRPKEEFDHLLELSGLVDTEERKVKLRVEI